MKFLVAFKIWIIAVVINTLLGTTWLTHFFSDQDAMTMFLFFGFVFGMMASFPIFIALLIVLSRSVSKNEYGKTIFIKVLITGIVLSIIAFLLFFYFTGFGLQDFALFVCTLLSSAISVLSQYKSLMRLHQTIEFDKI